MYTPRNTSKGFATAVIIGGVVVATVVGGVFYFLRGADPDITVVEKKDEEDLVVGLPTDAPAEALLRGVQRDDEKNYYLVLDINRSADSDKVEDACREVACKTDSYFDDPVSFRERVEACMVLKNPVGREMYDVWSAGTRETPFPLYYAVLGVKQDAFNQEILAEGYRNQLALYHSDSLCDRSESLRLLAEAYLTLSNVKGRSMYDEWLTTTGEYPFPLYYAIFGLDEIVCSPDGLTDIYQRLIELYEFGFYGDNPEVLRLLTEAYLTLFQERTCFLYKSWLDEGSEEGEKTFSLRGILQLQDVGDGLNRLDIENAGLLLSTLDLSSSGVGSVLNTFDNLSPSDIGAVLKNLDGLNPSDIGSVLNALGGLTSASIGSVLANIDNLSPANLGNVLTNIDGLSPADLGSVLTNIDGLSPADMGNVLSNVDGLSPANLGNVLTNIDGLSPADLGSVLTNIDGLSPADLGSVLTNIDGLSPADLGSVLTNIDGLSPADMGNVLSNVDGLSPANLGNVLTNIDGLSPANLGSVLTNIDGLSPANVNVVIDNLNLSPNFDINIDDLDLSPDVTINTDDLDLSPTPSPGSGLGIFRGINLFLDNLIPPSSDPSSGGGDGDDGEGEDDLPIVSIEAVASYVKPGNDVGFRIVVDNRSLAEDLSVDYTCATSNDALTDSPHIGSNSITIPNELEVFLMPTREEEIGFIECVLDDDSGNSPGDVGSYVIGNGSARVNVGIDGPFEEDFSRAGLPVVSIIAYRRDANAAEGDKFGEVINRLPVGSDPADLGLFGLVVDDFYLLSGLLDDFSENALMDSVSIPNPAFNAGTAGNTNVYVLASDVFNNNVSTSYYVNSDLNVIGSDGSVYEANRRWAIDEDGNITIEKRGDAVLLRDATGPLERYIICGLDENDIVICTQPFIESGVRRPDILRVVVQCYRDPEDIVPNRSSGNRDDPIDKTRTRQVFGLMTGGRHRGDTDGEYQKTVDRRVDKVIGGYRIGGVLYDFALPFGFYYDVETEGYVPIDAPVDAEFFPLEDGVVSEEGVVSCEITSGGDGDRYRVGIRNAAVRIDPKPVVSIEGKDGVRFNPAGDPIAYIPYDNTQYVFEEGVGDNPGQWVVMGGIPDDAGSKEFDLSVVDGLLAGAGAGFLTSFGSCVGANFLNSAIGGIIDHFKGGAVPTKNDKLDAKECALDASVSGAAMGLITSVAADYITWAHEGFKDKPLFVQNPTTFYQNMRDAAVGRAIDRSGLGFLCDARFGFDADFYNAKIRLELQHKYSRVRIQPPRCTYSALRNNLEEYVEDAQDFLDDPDKIEEFVKAFQFIELDSAAFSSSPSGQIVDITPTKSEAGRQLDALSKTLEDNFAIAQDSENLLQSISRVDDEVDRARREVDTVAKPPQQIFNPSDPKSISSFEKCDESQNPEGREDCYVIKASASFIDNNFKDATGAPLERLKTIDEIGELGDLLKVVLDSTLVGLMRKSVEYGFGTKVARDTALDLRKLDAAGSVSGRSRPGGIYGEAGAHTVSLGRHWWAPFFDDNVFYSDIVNAEMYAVDSKNLFDFIAASFYQEPQPLNDDAIPMPPMSLYTSFHALEDDRGTRGVCVPQTTSRSLKKEEVCTHGYEFWKNNTHQEFSKHYRSFDEEDPIAKNKQKEISGVNSILQGIGYNEEKGDGETKRAAIRNRFKDAYRFLSSPIVRSEYNSFVDLIISRTGVNKDRGGLIEQAYVGGGEGTITTITKKAVCTAKKIKSHVCGANDPDIHEPIENIVFGGDGRLFVLEDGASAVTTEIFVNEDLDVIITHEGKGEETVISHDWSGEFFTDRMFSDGPIYDELRYKSGRCQWISDIGDPFKVGVTVTKRGDSVSFTGLHRGKDLGELGHCKFEFEKDESGVGIIQWQKPMGGFVNESSRCDGNFLVGGLGVRVNLPADKIDFPGHWENLSSSVFGKGSAQTCETRSESVSYCEYTDYSVRERDEFSGFDDFEEEYERGSSSDTLGGRDGSGFTVTQRCTPKNATLGNCMTQRGRCDEIEGGKIVQVDETTTVCAPDYAEYSNAVWVNARLTAMKALRDIYESTLLAHIELVGSEEEYTGFVSVENYIRDYRDTVLKESEREYSSAREAWEIVRDETLKKIRDGTASVYLHSDGSDVYPLTKKPAADHEEFIALHNAPLNICSSSGESFGKGKYLGTTCELGVIHENDAYFVVRRKQGVYSERLKVDVLCGNVGGGIGGAGSLKRSGNVRKYEVDLLSGQNEVSFAVPARPPFESSGASPDGFVRCEIDKVFVSGANDDVSGEYVSPERASAYVQVSQKNDHRYTLNTFANLVQAVMSTYDVPTSKSSRLVGERRCRIGDGILYTYLWGHYAGFINMPITSIQNLVSVPAFAGDQDRQNQVDLQRYQFLNLLFSYPGSDTFNTESFGLIPPKDARDEYERNYGDRFNNHLGTSLGNFLRKIPVNYQQY